MPSLFDGPLNVSRETNSLLLEYEGLLRSWNQKINLVAKSTLAEVRHRHTNDSLQLANFLPEGVIVDYGSGAGLPAIPLAILFHVDQKNADFYLVESDTRKVAFLRTVSMKLKLNVSVLHQRIEESILPSADAVSARAFAPLDKIIDLSQRHLKPTGKLVLLKGKTWRAEVEQAKMNWNFDLSDNPSETNDNSRILILSNINRSQNEQP